MTAKALAKITVEHECSMGSIGSTSWTKRAKKEHGGEEGAQNADIHQCRDMEETILDGLKSLHSASSDTKQHLKRI
jgi:hypothetical protein